MNGSRPPYGSKPSLAITAYLTWLSTGTPIAPNSEAPFGPHALARIKLDASKVNLEAGRIVYEARCASCHGSDGQGDPPVWGPRSYNAGAGVAQVHRLAAWLRVTMPPDDPSLSVEEAVNVAAYVNAQPRPDFVLRDHLPADELGRYHSTVLDEVVRAPTWPPRK
jgi:thiosulfate dehydrogenase